MSEASNKDEKKKPNKVYFWDEAQPNIGVCITELSGTRGVFHAFEPLRSYRKKRDGQLKTCYTHSFTEEQAEAFGNVIISALNYIRANRPHEAADMAAESPELPLAA